MGKREREERYGNGEVKREGGEGEKAAGKKRGGEEYE